MSAPATTCPWCEKPLGPGTVRLTGRAVCSNCGAAITDPWPDDKDLDAAYGDWYWPQEGNRFSLIGDAMLRRSRAAMAKRIDEVAPPGPVLDVGAGEGTLIDALRDLGRDATGMERDSGREDMLGGSIDEIEGKWAAVVFWHSLEHLRDPGNAVRQAARLLSPGGVVFIAVPNTSSLQARIFGDRWLHLDLPRHLVHFSSASLQDGLKGAGFRILSTSPTRGGQVVIGWLDGLVTSLPGGLNLYQALRRKSARRIELSPGRRAASIVAGVILFPVALAGAALEIARGNSGTIYVEAQAV